MPSPRYPRVIKALPRDAIAETVLFATLAAICVCMLPVLLLMEGGWVTRLILLALMLTVGGYSVWEGVNVLTARTIFEADSVTVRTAWGARRFERAALYGWRPGGERAKLRLLELYTRHANRPFIAPISMQRDDVIAAWFEGARNLSFDDLKRSVEDVEADETFGHSKDERIIAVDRENQFLGFAGFGVISFALWLIVFPEPYHYLVGAGIAAPILIVIATIVRRDRWNIDRGDHDLRPITGNLIAFCAGALWLRAVQDWRVINWGHATLLALAAGVLLTLVLMLIFRPNFRWRLLLWLGVALAYAYGAILPLNMWFDRARPEIHRAGVARILEDTFQLNTEPPLPPEVEREASEEFLQRLRASGEACLPIYRGAFGIASYDVVLCDDINSE